MSQSAKKARMQVAGALSKQIASRRGWAKPVSADATLLSDKALQRAGFPDPSLIFRWQEIAGPETARVAQPVRCRKGPEGTVLTLKCEPSASVFLQHETRSLLDRLNAFLGHGAISRIRIVPGALRPARDVASHPFPKPAPGQKRETGAQLENALDRLEKLRKSTPKGA